MKPVYMDGIGVVSREIEGLIKIASDRWVVRDWGPKAWSCPWCGLLRASIKRGADHEDDCPSRVARETLANGSPEAVEALRLCKTITAPTRAAR